jgi:hypothetical protein
MNYKENNEFHQKKSLRQLSVNIINEVYREPSSISKKVVVENNSVDKVNKFKTSKKKSIERKSKDVGVDNLIFYNSSINFLFPKPFKTCLKKISYAHQINNNIYLEAEINSETLEFLSAIINDKSEINSNEDYQVDYKQIELNVNIRKVKYPDGKCQFYIRSSDHEWQINGIENENIIFVCYTRDENSLTKDQFKNKILTGQICPYCECKTQMVTDKEIFGNYSSCNKIFIQCVNNPDHYVGTFANRKALGRLANKSLRQKKMEAHALFDPLWQGQNHYFKSRDTAYKWLSVKMKLPKEEAHFGMFDELQCNIAIRIINRFHKKRQLIQSFRKYFKKQ